MEPVGHRITALVVLFMTTLFFGVAPLFLFRYWTKRREANASVDTKKGSRSAVSYHAVLNVFLFFGGGVLLATCFVHLIPEVRSNFDNYLKSHNKTEERDHHEDDKHKEADHDHDEESGHGHHHEHGVPYVELAICGGFFLIYILEEIVHTFIGHQRHSDNEESEEAQTVALPPPNYSATGQHLRNSVSNIQTDPERQEQSDSLELSYINHAFEEPATLQGNGPPVPKVRRRISDHPVMFPANSATTSEVINVTLPPNQEVLLPVSVRFARGLVTITAFSVHSVFDGIAIGLQETSSDIWTMFLAICVHKFVVAFAVGMELFEQTSSLTITTIHMTLFSLMSPIGILIVIVSERTMSEGDSPVIIILSAVATGTILYIVFFEILQRDRSKDGSKLTGFILFISMIVGFVSMACITLFIVH